MNAAVTARMAALDGAGLVAALLLLEPKVAERSLSIDERLVRAWILEELERRYPEVDAALDRWAASADMAGSYVDVLVANLPAMPASWAAGATIVCTATGATARLARREEAVSGWGWMLADAGGLLLDRDAHAWRLTKDVENHLTSGTD